MDAGISNPLALGAAVRRARAVRGWTQQDLAGHAGVSRAFVIDLERGARPRAELMRVLAVLRALGKALVLVDDAARSDDDLLGEVFRRVRS
jgi:y4mF family transcriptional regulator